MANQLTNLQIDRVSYCGRGINKHARIALYKKAPAADAPAVRLAKMCCETERGAILFADAVAKEAAERAYWKANEAVSPLLCAVGDSVRSIVGNVDLDENTKREMLKTSVEQFAAALSDAAPLGAMADAIAKSLSDSTAVDKIATLAAHGGNPKQGDSAMPEPTTAELSKTIEKMQADLDKADRIRKATKDEASHMADMTPEQRDTFMAKSPEDRGAAMKKAADDVLAKAEAERLAKASDETLTVDGVSIRKSDNPGMFAILKSQQATIAANAAEIAKANDRAEMVTLTKRASDEFGALPGTPVAKAEVLKHLATAPEAVRATCEAIFKAAQAQAGKAFGRIGTSKSDDGTPADDGSAKAVWKGKVEDVKKANPGMSGQDVLSKAQELHPTEFAAAYPTTADAVAKSTAAAHGSVAA